MKNNILVTIIVASYNAEKYIIQTLESCINQSYANLEIIITDDFSKDNSVALIDEWILEKQLSHPNIKCILLSSSENKGIPANLNKAIPHIRGKWVKCIGSDDILISNAIALLIENVESDPFNKEIGVVYSYYETFGENVKVNHKYPLAWTKNICSLQPSYLKKKLAMLHFNNVAPCAFINSKYLDEFNKDYFLLEDLPLWLKMIDGNVRTKFVNICTVKYRIHAHQITARSNQKVNSLLIKDLILLNEYRFRNKHYVAFLHNKFNLFCDLKRHPFYRWLKIINPFNLLIRFIETVGK